MVERKNYYQILGVPENATQKEIQKAYHKLAMQNHEDYAPDELKSAAKERMEVINEAYEILGDVELRKNYDNKYELNGGSYARWMTEQAEHGDRALRDGVRGASEKDAAVIEFFLSESLGDYRHSDVVERCAGWLLELVEKTDMAKSAVNAAFKMALHKNDFRLVDALLKKALLERDLNLFRPDKVHRFAENIKGRSGGVRECYKRLADIFCVRYTIARDSGRLEEELGLASDIFGVPALQEQISGDPGGLLLTLLKYAPQVITQKQFTSYNGLVYKLGWTHHGDLRDHNEKTIREIMKARPDIIRHPQEAYEKKFSLTAMPWEGWEPEP